MLFVVTASIVCSGSSHSTSGHVAVAPDSLQVILGKISLKPVPSRFEPVIIYRSTDTGRSEFIGSGSLFITKNGDEQLVTAEHIFYGGSGDRLYTVRSLRTQKLSGVKNVTHGFALTGEFADVATTQTGWMEPIAGFSTHINGLLFNPNVTPLLVIQMVTSLVSGQKVRVLATMKDPLGGPTDYVILDYASIAGESGLGFVDEYDNIYILKGNFPNYKRETLWFLGEFTGITVAFGPLRLP